ncbi:glycosyl transferase [Azospirillum halopraeferens]|uniref:glycosyl transferase n=1 Tax=Azospirillum halopraeferens TaxID=34010 RepID=UPI0003FE27B5|nr:glycosyl transferase [Azospirillum halopraeferens]
MIRVFIGYDPNETVAWHVLSHSIHTRSSRPVTIAPVMLSQLDGLMWRERNPLQSTEFSFSRFLVPYLCGYEGWAIFMDCDMMVVDDIARLWDLRDDRYAVMATKHDHRPKEDVKFLGAVQTRYEKKNWSAVMMFNCAACRALTPEYVNTASGLELHQFKWLDGDERIGDIPLRWNHLVGYQEDRPLDTISNLHWTVGGPYFDAYADTSYAREWFAERDAMLHATSGRGTGKGS